MESKMQIRQVDMDIFEEIKKLKVERNAVILAHYYQDADIQDIADFIGDSLALSQQAAKTKAEMIVFAGVHFMAETAKILNPKKKVVMPDLNAGCSLADSCPATEFAEFKKQHPGAVVISYINCTAEVKTLSDIICTSGNAEKIIKSVPVDKEIIFAPDRNMGSYLAKKTGRNMILWDGSCMVHELFSLQKITHLKEMHPKAKLIAHPECEQPVLKIADMIGSTSAMLKFTQEDNSSEYIVATETGILHQMKLASPHKTFIAAPPDNNCACNDCPHMKLNTLEKLYLCMRDEKPEITLPPDLMKNAEASLRRMLELSAN